MMSNGFDAASDARFRAMAEAEQRWSREQINLLWQHMSKRRAEIERAEDRLGGQIEAIKTSINSGIRWLALAAGGLLLQLARAKIGF
jgi:hypothetical protein